MTTIRLSAREQDLRNRAAAAARAFDRDPTAPFRRAIAEKPDDNAPRLVFADWLDEHGRAGWAALIRAGVAAMRLAGEQPDGLWRTPGHPSERRWWGPFPASVRFGWPVRGFPEAALFGTLQHALRWARPVGLWLPVRRLITPARPDHFGVDYVSHRYGWYEGPYPNAGRGGPIPPAVFRWLGPFRGSGDPADWPELQWSQTHAATRRTACYPNYELACAGLERALTDYARHLADLPPLHNPTPLVGPRELFE